MMRRALDALRDEPGRRVQIAQDALAIPHRMVEPELFEERHRFECVVLGLAGALRIGVSLRATGLFAVGPRQLEALVNRLEKPDRLAGLRVRLGMLSLERVDQSEHAVCRALLELIFESDGAPQGVL